MNVYVIYTPDGKRYVGVEGKDGRRIRTHRRGYELKNKKPSVIALAIQSAGGWDNCRWRYLAKNCTSEQAWQLERFFIAYFQTQNPNIGHNRSAGGTHGAYGMRHSEETKAKILTKRAWYKQHSPETRAKISAALKGHAPMSEESQKQAWVTRRNNGLDKQTAESNRKRSEKLKGRPAPVKGTICLPAGPNGERRYFHPAQLI